MADFRLADTVDAPESLFNPIGIPRKVVIHHEMGPLQIDTLSGRIRSQQHLDFGIVFE